LGWVGAALCAAAGLAAGLLAGLPLSRAYHLRAEPVRWDEAAALSKPTLQDWNRLYFDRVPDEFRRPNASLTSLDLVVEHNDSPGALCDVLQRLGGAELPEADPVRARARAELRNLAAGHDADALADLVAALSRFGDEDAELLRLRRQTA